jgi:hypothetical protein
MAIKIVSFPIKNCDFSTFILVYQMVIILSRLSFISTKSAESPDDGTDHRMLRGHVLMKPLTPTISPKICFFFGGGFDLK